MTTVPTTVVPTTVPPTTLTTTLPTTVPPTTLWICEREFNSTISTSLTGHSLIEQLVAANSKISLEISAHGNLCW